MTEGDDEDLWLECLALTRQMLKGKVMTYEDRLTAADDMYARIKARTAKGMSERPKLVVQMK